MELFYNAPFPASLIKLITGGSFFSLLARHARLKHEHYLPLISDLNRDTFLTKIIIFDRDSFENANILMCEHKLIITVVVGRVSKSINYEAVLIE